MHIYYDHNSGIFRNQQPHITLFRCENVIDNQVWKSTAQKFREAFINKDLKVEFVDVSTRFEYDETLFYKPLVRVAFNEDMEEENTQKKIE